MGHLLSRRLCGVQAAVLVWMRFADGQGLMKILKCADWVTEDEMRAATEARPI